MISYCCSPSQSAQACRHAPPSRLAGCHSGVRTGTVPLSVLVTYVQQYIVVRQGYNQVYRKKARRNESCSCCLWQRLNENSYYQYSSVRVFYYCCSCETSGVPLMLSAFAVCPQLLSITTAGVHATYEYYSCSCTTVLEGSLLVDRACLHRFLKIENCCCNARHRQGDEGAAALARPRRHTELVKSTVSSR